MMTTETEEMQHLQLLLDRLREEWYAAGRGAEFEGLVERYRSRGAWPFH